MRPKPWLHSTKYIKWNIHTRTITRTTSDEFISVLPEIARNCTTVRDLPKSKTDYYRLFDYNLSTGDKIKGLMTVNAYKCLEMPQNLTTEKECLAKTLGWCIEIMEMSTVMLEDIITHSEMRWGKPCWYKQTESSADAINDCCFLEQSVFKMLTVNFGKHSGYRQIVELFHNVALKTCMGNIMNDFPRRRNKPNLENFTMNNYQKITQLKRGYLFQMPLLLAMYMAESQDLGDAGHAKALLMNMGVFRKIQKDFLDCFGDPKETERGGMDIRQGRCSWLAVKSLEKVTPHQRNVMEKYYGNPTTESVEVIRHLYEELGLPECYMNLQEASFQSFRQRIRQMSEGLLQNLFLDLVEQLSKT